jgi:hypothetical protein
LARPIEKGAAVVGADGSILDESRGGNIRGGNIMSTITTVRELKLAIAGFPDHATLDCVLMRDGKPFSSMFLLEDISFQAGVSEPGLTLPPIVQLKFETGIP